MRNVMRTDVGEVYKRGVNAGDFSVFFNKNNLPLKKMSSQAMQALETTLQWLHQCVREDKQAVASGGPSLLLPSSLSSLEDHQSFATLLSLQNHAREELKGMKESASKDPFKIYHGDDPLFTSATLAWSGALQTIEGCVVVANETKKSIAALAPKRVTFSSDQPRVLLPLPVEGRGEGDSPDLNPAPLPPETLHSLPLLGTPMDPFPSQLELYTRHWVAAHTEASRLDKALARERECAASLRTREEGLVQSLGRMRASLRQSTVMAGGVVGGPPSSSSSSKVTTTTTPLTPEGEEAIRKELGELAWALGAREHQAQGEEAVVEERERWRVEEVRVRKEGVERVEREHTLMIQRAREGMETQGLEMAATLAAAKARVRRTAERVEACAMVVAVHRVLEGRVEEAREGVVREEVREVTAAAAAAVAAAATAPKGFAQSLVKAAMAKEGGGNDLGGGLLKGTHAGGGNHSSNKGGGGLGKKRAGGGGGALRLSSLAALVTPTPMEKLKEEERRHRGFLAQVFLQVGYSEERAERVEGVLRTLLVKSQTKQGSGAEVEQCK